MQYFMRGDFIKRLMFLLLFMLALLPKPSVSAATLQSQAGQVSTASGSLNVRSSPSVSAPRVITLPRGSHVTLLERAGDWWRIEYGKGLYGYCSASYLMPISSTPLTVATSSGSLNVRTGPGTSYSKAASLYKGEVVLSLSTSGGWTRILYHGGKVGFVSSQYLSGVNAPVSLWVPSFKQTDPRWASLTLGTSGKPMSQIGCATTAIAMLESHRQGKQITPDVMASQLRYTATGSVYWPSHYRVDTNASGYLTKVYNLLKQGKPILFGATNQYGSQHWVIVKGFTGGDIRSENFSILDPGSSSRTTLAQFLSVYPNFYKYFTY